MEPFLDKQKCKKIISNKTCFKSVKGSCIDLFLTSKPSLYQFANVFETGIRDYYLLIYTMVQSTYTKRNSNVLTKRCFKNLSEQSSLQDLKQGLSDNDNFSDFNNGFKNTLSDHKSPGENKTYVNKILRK